MRCLYSLLNKRFFMRNSQRRKHKKKIQIAKQHKGKSNKKKNINAAMFSLMIIWMLALLPKKPHNFLFHLNFLSSLIRIWFVVCDQVRNGFCLLAQFFFYRQCCSILQILYHWISNSAKSKEMVWFIIFKLRVSKNQFEIK